VTVVRRRIAAQASFVADRWLLRIGSDPFCRFRCLVSTERYHSADLQSDCESGLYYLLIVGLHLPP
jgi:hypothetical protein